MLLKRRPFTMGSNSVTIIAAVILLFSANYVNGQWCTGTSETQTKTADDEVVDYIASINYPSHYENYIDCDTTISTSTGSQILFYVEYQSIERSYDYLRIYSNSVTSSNLLYDSDRYFPPYVGLSSSTVLQAVFHTDYSITYGGFKMSFVAVSIPSCNIDLTATSTYQQLSYVYREQTSPCTWSIVTDDTTSAFGVEVKVILVQGSVFVTESGSDTILRTANSVFVSGANTSSIEITGYYGNDFVVLYKQVQVSTVTGVMITTTPSSAVSICSASSRTSYESTTQYLISPDYPGQYDNNLVCSVTIEADNSSQSIFVHIEDYAVATDDELLIYDGPSTSFNGLSNVNTGNNYTSSGSGLYLIFLTNSIGRNRGFYLSYRSVDRTVPDSDPSYTLQATVTASTSQQTMDSPNYPNVYDSSDDKYWLIVKPSQTDRIVLDFRDFQVEQAYDCIYDYVSIYDGASTSDPLIAKICGYNAVTFEDSSGSYILIHFHTDSSVQRNGWRLTYYIGEYQDPDAAASESESSGVKDYIYPLIGIAVIGFIAFIVFGFIYFHKNARVIAGVISPPVQKRTTHDLMTELKKKQVSAETNKKPKVKRKGQGYHPQPNPPGANVNVIVIGSQSPHPPPAMSDPVYPPPYIGTDTYMPRENIAPVLTEQSRNIPSAPIQNIQTSSMIPAAFTYLTPAQAREAGVYGQ